MGEGDMKRPRPRINDVLTGVENMETAIDRVVAGTSDFFEQLKTKLVRQEGKFEDTLATMKAEAAKEFAEERKRFEESARKKESAIVPGDVEQLLKTSRKREVTEILSRIIKDDECKQKLFGPQPEQQRSCGGRCRR